MNPTGRVLLASFAACSMVPLTGSAQVAPKPAYETRTVVSGGRSFQYLDFGGSGLPVILITPLDAAFFKDLGAMLRGENRILALTPGAPNHVEPSFPRTAESVLAVMDGLQIERAVLVSNIADVPTYLAEHHPQRVAGLVFLGGPPRAPETAWAANVPHRAFEMFVRAVAPPGANLEIDTVYRARYLESDQPTMHMPALLFEIPGGMRGVERMNFPLMLAGSPLAAEMVGKLPPEQGRARFERLIQDKTFRDQQHAQIRDTVARAFFQKLAADPALQAELHKFWEESAVPFQRALWERFRRAFAENLTIVRLDVPAVSGYEYRDAPALIHPHIRRFLQEVGAREAAVRR